ncbi:hypothetical protein [Streptomyces sp. WL006]|uniref:hypothetical protein n=1 Tax=Streptomyces sp. WL006 TaxID=3423915 RepID=UPI003F6CDFE0
MTSVQRALGRNAQSGSGGYGSTGIAFIDGQVYDVDLMAHGGVRTELRDTEPQLPTEDGAPEGGE